VDEGGENYAIRRGCSTAQAFQVFEITSMHMGASSDTRLGGRPKSHQQIDDNRDCP
jgi:hypothetical protein